VAASAFSCANSAAFGDESKAPLEILGLSGSVRGGYWSRDRSFTDDHRHLGVGSLWLAAEPVEVEGFKLKAEGFIQSENATRAPQTRSDLREAFVTTSIGAVDLKVGRSIIVWGRADKFNPTDVFSTRDYTLLTTDDEDQRLGAVNTWLAANFGNYRFIGIWQPEWRGPKYPLLESPSIIMNQKRPAHPERQFGLKLDHSGGVVDWSVSYAHVMNRTPDLELAEFSANGLAIDMVHRPVRMYGADFASTLGSFGLRGEAALIQTDDNAGQDPLKQNSSVTAVLGADNSPIENLNVNVQWLYRNVIRFNDHEDLDPLTSALSESLNLNAQQQGAAQHGVSARPSYKLLNDALEIEVSHIRWIGKTGSYLWRPKVSYAVSDHVRWAAGGEWYEADRDTYFGRLKDLSHGFTEVRWLF